MRSTGRPTKRTRSIKPSGTTMLIAGTVQNVQSIRFEREEPVYGPYLRCAHCYYEIYWGFEQDKWFHVDGYQLLCWWGRDDGSVNADAVAQPEGWQKKLI